MTLQERLETYLSRTPKVHPSAYVAPQSTLIGAVTLDAQTSVWPNTVLRADINTIEVGEGSNIQDGCVVHLADDFGVKIGKYVTIGHMAMIHACTIGDECLIGMHSTILDGAQIGHNSIVGAGSLVTKNTLVPPGSLVIGSPAKVVRALSPEEQAALKGWAEKYTHVARAHKQATFSKQP